MYKVTTIEDLKELFTKPYGEADTSKKKWSEFYNDNVIFIDPKQETNGLDSYIEAQEKLLKRCDDFYIETHAIAITESVDSFHGLWV
tara:strand:+ start:35 stop:295 length:261 start_codon:yes stop_codon:yes gene_type:complete